MTVPQKSFIFKGRLENCSTGTDLIGESKLSKLLLPKIGSVYIVIQCRF